MTRSCARAEWRGSWLAIGYWRHASRSHKIGHACGFLFEIWSERIGVAQRLLECKEDGAVGMLGDLNHGVWFWIVCRYGRSLSRRGLGMLRRHLVRIFSQVL